MMDNLKTMLLVVVVAVAGSVDLTAQVSARDVPVVNQTQQRFDTGQDIQPFYEGWVGNEDGSFTLHFGYMNRNYREQPNIPIGPNNYFSPGLEDRGQPSYFYPRSQRYTFTVTMPADMGRTVEDALVWTVTRHGSEQRAVGWLQPEWEIDENTITSNGRTGNGRPVEEMFANQDPVVAVSADSTTVAVGEELTLTARLTDDALPSQLPPRRSRPTLPSLTPPDDLPQTPDNVRWYRKPLPPRNGLSVAWIVYRGPDDASFNPIGYQRAVAEEEPVGRRGYFAAFGPLSSESQSLEGEGFPLARFETPVTFSEPGTYTLRAYGCDSMAVVPADIVVTVTAGD